MVDTRSEFERSWASIERKPDEEQRDGTAAGAYEQESLQRQVDVLTKKLEIYRSREVSLRKYLDAVRDEEGKKEIALQDVKQNNQLLVKKVLEKDNEIGLMRGRLKDNRENSINLSKEIFSLKKQKGFDDKSQKLREENFALRKELIRIRDGQVQKIDHIGDDEDSKNAKASLKDHGEKIGEEVGLKIGKTERMAMEGLKWQLWASQEGHGDVKGSTVKWTQASSAMEGTDFVNFQNEVEEVCQELQQKTTMMQKLRKDLRQKESEFSNSFSKSMTEANETLAKVKEEAADNIAALQEQLKQKETVENSNSELKTQVESLQSNQKSMCDRFDMENAEKDKRIHALEKTISTQKQAIKNVKEEMQEISNQIKKLSIDKTKEARDLHLQISALKAKSEALEKTVTELNATVERQKIDYLAQVQSLQLMIEELEREGPLFRAIETLEKTEMMTEVRIRVGDLKAMNQRLQEENLKLGFRIDAAAMKLQKMDAEEVESKELRTEFARMKEELDLFQVPTIDDVQSENVMLHQKFGFIAAELRQDEETKEWQTLSSDASTTESSSYSSKSDNCDELTPVGGAPIPNDQSPASEGYNMNNSEATIGRLDLIKESIDDEKWL